jgi:uncharacterized protein YjbK
MEYLHVINTDKHNTGYKDRDTKWIKFHLGCYNDHGWTRLCEIDQMRFINFIRLELQTKAPVLLDNDYLKSQGFRLKDRCLTSTIRQLAESKLIEIRSEAEQKQINSRLEAEQEQELKIVEPKGLTPKSGTQIRIEKKRIDKKKHSVKIEPMIPPTLQDVSSYIQEKDYQVNARAFHDKYSNENPPWSNNKGKPMTSWKSTLATWNGNAQKNNQARNRDEHGKLRVAL